MSFPGFNMADPRDVSAAQRAERAMYRQRARKALDVIARGRAPIKPEWAVHAWDHRHDEAYMAALTAQAELGD